MDQKDQLGEKLRLKELGDEDRYFGARDREALASVKARQATTQEQAIRAQSQGRCPQWGAPLHERAVHGVTMLECVPCQGIWLNKDNLPTIAPPSGGAWFETFLRGLGWWRPFHCD